MEPLPFDLENHVNPENLNVWEYEDENYSYKIRNLVIEIEDLKSFHLYHFDLNQRIENHIRNENFVSLLKKAIKKEYDECYFFFFFLTVEDEGIRLTLNYNNKYSDVTESIRFRRQHRTETEILSRRMTFENQQIKKQISEELGLMRDILTSKASEVETNLTSKVEQHSSKTTERFNDLKNYTMVLILGGTFIYLFELFFGQDVYIKSCLRFSVSTVLGYFIFLGICILYCYLDRIYKPSSQNKVIYEVSSNPVR